jgi:hypothetical protein
MPVRRGTATLPYLLICATVVHVSACVLLFLLSFGPAGLQPFQLYTSTAGVVFLLAVSGTEFVLAARVVRRFDHGEPLHRAWLIILLAALCRFAAFLLMYLVARVHPPVRTLGLLLAGPIQLLVMGAGLFVVYRLYCRLGFRVSLRTSDFLALAGVGLYVVFTSTVISLLAKADGQAITLLSFLGWITDPLLCIVLLEALLLRRMVMKMGGGLVERCWTSYSVAILLTAAGDLAFWLLGFRVRGDAVALSWLVWYPAAAAYALGPAWQLEAIRYAERRGASTVACSLHLE